METEGDLGNGVHGALHVGTGRGVVRADPPLCCTPTQAIAWLGCLAEMATLGDDDARAALGAAAPHYLDSLHQAGVPR